MAPLLAAPIDDGPRPDRVATAVAQRVQLFEAMGTVGTFARLRAPFHTPVADALGAVRRLLRDRLRAALAPAPDDVVAASDVLCSFEAYRRLRDDHGHSPEVAERIMTTGVLALAAAVVPA